MTLRAHLPLLALVLLLGSCHGQRTPASTASSLPQTGTVQAKVPCSADPTLSYALYLPTSYIPGTRIPVYIAFDPEASGSLPVNRYKDLAERYGFILMGSNDSRNGQGMDVLGRIAEVLFREAAQKFQADSTDIYLMGFSGGARVSCIIGLYWYKVKGVIACGAGFPGNQQAPSHTFDYFAFVGDKDFNLSELISLDRELSGVGWPHQLWVWEGPHAWPPLSVMEKGVQWMRGELPPVPPPAKPLAEVYGIDKEIRIQQEMVDRLAAGDTLWFASEIARLHRQQKNAKSRSDSLLPARLLSFLGVMVYSRANGNLQYNLLNQAYRTLVIYRMVEPKNPAVDSLFKIYYSKKSP